VGRTIEGRKTKEEQPTDLTRRCADKIIFFPLRKGFVTMCITTVQYSPKEWKEAASSSSSSSSSSLLFTDNEEKHKINNRYHVSLLCLSLSAHHRTVRRCSSETARTSPYCTVPSPILGRVHFYRLYPIIHTLPFKNLGSEDATTVLLQFVVEGTSNTVRTQMSQHNTHDSISHNSRIVVTKNWNRRRMNESTIFGVFY